MNKNQKLFSPALAIKGLVLSLLAVFTLLAMYLGTFPLTKLTPFFGRAGYFDWPIFIASARDFLSGNPLYVDDLSRYAPNAAIYKFPPLFASLLIVLLKTGLNEDTLRVAMAFLQLGCYFSSIAIVLYLLQAPKKFYLVISLFLFIACFEPFVDNFVGLQLEALILLALSASLLALRHQKYHVCGSLLAFASLLKLYPLIFCLFFLFHAQKTKLIIGFVIGALVLSGFSMGVVGLGPHWFYFHNIAPMLFMEDVYNSHQNVSLHNALHRAGVHTLPSFMLSLVLFIPALILTAQQYRRPLNSPSQHIRDFLVMALWVCVFVLATKNSWGNYQLLLCLPIIGSLILLFKNKPFDIFSMALLYTACFLIFLSPPHRLSFFLEAIDAYRDWSVASLFVWLRSVAALMVLGVV